MKGKKDLPVSVEIHFVTHCKPESTEFTAVNQSALGVEV
jgi:hypothetical protein